VTPYYTDGQVTVHHGDCLNVLPTLPDASVDAVVTDPPYGLEFMGSEWDSFAPKRTHYHGQRADTSKGVGNDDSKPSSRHHVTYAMGRPTLKRCVGCGKREFSGSPCRCESPEWAYEQPVGTPTRMAAYQQWCQAWAAECLRVLKPGGHLLAFGGTRTWHRLACAVEDAGFEIRDSITWIYAQGFPKSLDVSKALDRAAGAERDVVGTGRASASSLERVRRVEMGHRSNLTNVTPEAYPISVPATDDASRWAGWGTALKPAHEPIVVARKPLAGTVAQNVLTHGTGAINVDGCRVVTADDLNGGAYGQTGRSRPLDGDQRTGAGLGMYEPGRKAHGDYEQPAGRWPPNVVLDEAAAAELDRQSGLQRDGVAVNRNRGDDRPQTVAGAPRRIGSRLDVTYGGEGGASRFFPVFRYEPKAPTSERPRVDGDAHETVKPLDLMRWLVRLVTPPGGIVLDPFAGSGTTAEACVIEGFRCVAVEQAGKYLPLIVARLTKPIQPVLAMEVG
jgi:site-specific DNA-methyltransferase (adenine-specific)